MTRLLIRARYRPKCSAYCVAGLAGFYISPIKPRLTSFANSSQSSSKASVNFGALLVIYTAIVASSTPEKSFLDFFDALTRGEAALAPRLTGRGDASRSDSSSGESGSPPVYRSSSGRLANCSLPFRQWLYQFDNEPIAKRV